MCTANTWHDLQPSAEDDEPSKWTLQTKCAADIFVVDYNYSSLTFLRAVTLLILTELPINVWHIV